MSRRLAWTLVFLGVLAAVAPARAQEDAGATDGGAVDAALPDAALPDAAPIPCGDVDALGLCFGNIRRACVAGGLVQEDCEASRGAGFRCVLEPVLGAAVCDLFPLDGGISIEDGGQPLPDAGGTPLEPVTMREGHCVKPAWGPQALLGAGLWMWPRRRRTVASKDGPRA